MTSYRTPSRASSLASQDTNTSPQDAALKGASTAFGRPAAKARASSNTSSGANGALAAATSAGLGTKTPSPQNGGRTQTYPVRPPEPQKATELPRRTPERAALPDLATTTAPTLPVPQQPRREQSKSPSHFAAQVAAARASPASQVTGGSITSRPRREPGLSAAKRYLEGRTSTKPMLTTAANSVVKNDTTPISPTTSLVALFETHSRQSAKRPEPIVIKASAPLAIRSPKPIRVSDGVPSMFEMDLETKTVGVTPFTSDESAKQTLLGDEPGSSSDSYASAPEDVAAPPPVAVRKRGSPFTNHPDLISRRATRLDDGQSGGPSPSPSPLRSERMSPIAIQRTPTSPPETFSSSSQSISAAYHQLYPQRRITPLMTGDSLANAMVASSLASSRAPSPTKIPAPPIPVKRHKAHTFGLSRTPSPGKVTGMRHTLRKDESSDSDEMPGHPYGKHKKKRLVRKHPNKHHEGDRKRWRDAVTERERRRYEGVWAANKGVHYSFTSAEAAVFARAPDHKHTTYVQEAAADQVSNIVCRDIWTRSRLPVHVLADIWELVDSQGVGRLTKDEFVVGLWLIDQRLKGRKLPVKVTESVWASVRMLQGIKVRKK